MTEEDDLQKLKENDRRLREKMQVDEKPEDDIMRVLAERAKRVVNTDDDPPPEEVNGSQKAAQDSLQEMRANLRQARANKWDSKVPPRWKGWNLERLPAALRVEANEWIAEGYPQGNNLILAGPTGSGKTSIAYSIGREIYLQGGGKVKNYQVAELFEKMRNQDESKAIMEQVKEADLLVLDDLGAERQTEWVEERLYLIIDHRWQWQKPIIVTTNVKLENISQKFSGRVASRILDSATTIIVSGKDYRAE